MRSQRRLRWTTPRTWWRIDSTQQGGVLKAVILSKREELDKRFAKILPVGGIQVHQILRVVQVFECTRQPGERAYLSIAQLRQGGEELTMLVLDARVEAHGV